MSIVVLGDVMLDIFEDGAVERVSPEAPVPVLHNPSGYEVLGGAANTARSILKLGHSVDLIGLVGDDAAGRKCADLLVSDGIGNSIHQLTGWPTVTKHRFTSGGQQMLRVDREVTPPEESVELLLVPLRRALAEASALVISDYDKGVVTSGIARAGVALARSLEIPTIVDSKRSDPEVFRGCSVIAPNHAEATRATGISDPTIAAERIAASTESDVVITLGASGMLVRTRSGGVHHVPSRAREVADVTGAGDSVTAGLATALVEGLDVIQAAYFATQVAAVAVAHRGTYAVTRSDLAQSDTS